MYKFLGIHYSRWAWFFSPLAIFIRINIYPNSITNAYFKAFEDKFIIYVLPKMSLIDIIVLNKTLRKLKQKIVKSEARPKRFRFAAMLALKPRMALFHNENKEGFVCDMLNLIRNDPRAKEKKLVFMPLSVFWSRAAEREEQGFLLRSLFPDDGTGNGLQKLLMLILHRGEVNVFFGKSFDLIPPDTDHFADNQEKKTEVEYYYALKIRRLFNIEFAKERTAAFGPTLYDKDKINHWILSSKSTKQMIESSENPLKTKKQVVHHISEIAANYNYMTIRALEKIFDFLWNKVFDGVKVRNFESIERHAKDGQIIWMPSHRSHIDYLLLSYVLFKKGLVTPHVAAGINLNFWPVGSILRLGGAFFIRRSFSGNKVYANTFAEYVNFLLQNSFPIEFFHEGGRSRIGKLLSPKLGVLNMCVHSIMSRKAENTYFIPVYFGYDKVMEDDSYARELRGTKKQKENAFQFLNGIRKIFSNYGSVD
ncbi:MAG: 1-acyl-sn-glycerol-3-phosphate acyltransferase, partial [Bdellovibrionota bacterium]